MSAVMDLSAGTDICVSAVDLALAAGASDVEVHHECRELFEVNHETAEIGLIRSTVTDEVTVAAYLDGAKGTSTATGRAPDDLRRAVDDALAAARADRPDPGNVVAPGDAHDLVEVGHREPDRDAMIGAVSRHLDLLASDYPLLLAGDGSLYSFTNTWRSFANSAGARRQERQGAYSVSGIYTGKDGTRTTSFNYTDAQHVEPPAELVDSGTMRAVLDGTMASFDPRPVPETFVGDVIFTPDSLGTLIGPFTGSIGGMSLLRGTSRYADSLGESVAAPSITIRNAAGTDVFPLARGWDEHGIAAEPLEVVVDGVLRQHLIGWYTSHKLDRPMTCGVTAFEVSPGASTFDEMVSTTERGIVLGRFSGGRPNENLDFSGVAKNSFYVEDGSIVGPIAETMVAGNLGALLRSVRAVGDRSVNRGRSSFPHVATTGATISTK